VEGPIGVSGKSEVISGVDEEMVVLVGELGTVELGTAVEETVELGTAVEEAVEVGTAVEETVELETSVEETVELGTSVEDTVELGTSVEETVELATVDDGAMVDSGSAPTISSFQHKACCPVKGSHGLSTALDKALQYNP